MEYCAHCRAIRPTRKSTRRRTVRQPDGTVKTLIVDSYHCTRCNHFVGSIEREAAPSGTPSTAPSAGHEGEDRAPVPDEVTDEVKAAGTE